MALNSGPGNLHRRKRFIDYVRLAWTMALSSKSPAVIDFNRGAVPLLKDPGHHKPSQDVYIFFDTTFDHLTLVSTGGDLYRALDAARILNNDLKFSILAVSMPSMRRFSQQSAEYRQSATR